MAAIPRRAEQPWLARHTAFLLLAVTVSGLAAGGSCIWPAPGRRGCGLVAAGACGAAYALWAMAEALRRGRVGVDVIALLALAGALAVGELLAAAVISVMLASGRALEAWAAGRAHRDLRALLERAPRTARRYPAGRWWRCRSTRSMPGDLLLVAPGELVPVDGTVAGVAGGPGRVGADRRAAARRAGRRGTGPQRRGERRRARSTCGPRPRRRTAPTPGSSAWSRKRRRRRRRSSGWLTATRCGSCW